jgi:hypothetical protein
VLDLAFVAKAPDGSVRKVAVRDVEHSSDIDPTMWDGASSGLLDQSDIDQLASNVEPGSLGGMLVYENTWRCRLSPPLTVTGTAESAKNQSSLTTCSCSWTLPNPADDGAPGRRFLLWD